MQARISELENILKEREGELQQCMNELEAAQRQL